METFNARTILVDRLDATGIKERLAVLMLGLGGFLLFIGYRVLFPDNIAWLSTGDPAEHFIGWHFFRFAPWTLPLGLNPANGLEFSNAIVYSDSIPLLALLFKSISAALPPVFQYFGFWLLACFLLQACFGWKLAGLVTAHPFARLLIAAFFVSAPPMLLRTGGHLSLSGHFIILAAIYLVLRPDRRHQAAFWALLLVVAGLVHAYLLLMAGACWTADLVQGLMARREPLRRVVLQIIATIAALAVALWQAGYFSEREPGSGGFGYYRFNLLSLVDSSGWSHILPNIPEGPGDYEGFNYLGLGLLFLTLVAVAVAISGRTGISRRIADFRVFLAMLLVLAIYAASNNVGIGSLEVSVPLPPAALQATSMFRASGRIFWPVYYVLVFVIVYLVVRGLGRRLAVPLLGFALVVQVADTSAYWRAIRAGLMTEPASTWSTTLTDPFWQAAATRYNAVRRIVSYNAPPFWKDLSYYAATHGMGTDIVYLARFGQRRQAKAGEVALRAALSGNYLPDSLYIVAPEYVSLVALGLDPSRDLFARVDDQYVVAPGWNTCGDCPDLTAPLSLADVMPISPRGSTIFFDSAARGASHLVRGWSAPEPWGVWSNGRKAALMLRVPPDLHSLTIVADAFTPEASSAQRVVVSLNGFEVANVELRGGDQTIYVLVSEEVRTAAAVTGALFLDLLLPDAVSPMAFGMSDDPRELALGLKSITLN